MVEKVVSYQTSDGLSFHTYNEARAHERGLKFVAWCEAQVFDGWPVHTVAQKILEHWYVSQRKPTDKEDEE